MTLYRKTALVEAEQFLPGEGKIPAGVFSDELSDPRKSPAQWVLETLEGRHVLRDGDYICTGPKGEKWNVERAIFEATYESVEQASSGGGEQVGMPEGVRKAPSDRQAETLPEAVERLTKKHGDPNGTAYQQGVNDHGQRILALLRAPSDRQEGDPE